MQDIGMDRANTKPMPHLHPFSGAIVERPTILQPLRLGYVALNDALPFIVAKESGLFQKYGLDVKLSREIGWASIRDKVEYGELDAAQALAPMPFAATMGLGNRHPTECLVSLILNLNGNAITLSRSLLEKEGDPVQALKRGDFSHRSFGKPTLAVVSEFSSHHFLLRKWLIKHGIHPLKDVHIVTLPPSQMPDILGNALIDGFCAGEPWNSQAVRAGTGIVVASSLDVDPGHVEKVLMVSHRFATRRSETHIRLIAALIDACEQCKDPPLRSHFASILSERRYLNCPREDIEVGLEGRIVTIETQQLGILASQFLRFDSNRPSRKHCTWILKQMQDAGLMRGVSVDPDTLAKIVFAEEYYESALKLRSQMGRLEQRVQPTATGGH